MTISCHKNPIKSYLESGYDDRLRWSARLRVIPCEIDCYPSHPLGRRDTPRDWLPRH